MKGDSAQARPHRPALGRRGFLYACAASAILPMTGSAAGQLLSRRVITLDRAAFSAGHAFNVVFDPLSRPLKLKHSGANAVSSGQFVTQPLACHGARRLKLTWSPRWTGPTRWNRDGSNPLSLGVSDAEKEPNTLCSVVRLPDRYRMYFTSRGRGIRYTESATPDAADWGTASPIVLSKNPGIPHAGGGVVSPEVVAVDDTHWNMYYVGYHEGTHPSGGRTHEIGLATSSDGGLTWTHASRVPVIARGRGGSVDAFAASSASVIRHQGRWMMWYTGIKQFPYLASICLATSEDGVHWTKYAGNPVLNYRSDSDLETTMVAKPHVIFEDGVFRMWYSAMGSRWNAYRIHYAESSDGIHWDRCPLNPVLEPSEQGWDQNMVEYAEVLQADGAYHMWYSGDRYANIGHATGTPQGTAEIALRQCIAHGNTVRWTNWSTVPRPGVEIELDPRTVAIQLRITLSGTNPRLSPEVRELKITAS